MTEFPDSLIERGWYSPSHFCGSVMNAKSIEVLKQEGVEYLVIDAKEAP